MSIKALILNWLLWSLVLFCGCAIKQVAIKHGDYEINLTLEEK